VSLVLAWLFTANARGCSFLPFVCAFLSSLLGVTVVLITVDMLLVLLVFSLFSFFVWVYPS
jgi:hypothetical protein